MPTATRKKGWAVALAICAVSLFLPLYLDWAEPPPLDYEPAILEQKTAKTTAETNAKIALDPHAKSSLHSSHASDRPPAGSPKKSKPEPEEEQKTQALALPLVYSLEPPLHPEAQFAVTIRSEETTAAGAKVRRITPLTQTGSFVRHRPIFVVNIPIYEIASYVERPEKGTATKLLDGLLQPNQRRAYYLRFLFSLTGSQIREAMQHEIDRSFTDVDVKTHGADIERFLTLLDRGVQAGEVVYLYWTPDAGLYAGFPSHRELRVVTTVPSVACAIWRIWCGPTAEPGRQGLVSRWRTD